jgi:N-acetylmuramoyl-L-alanine amidase
MPKLFEDFTEEELLAACIWGEARGESRKGKIAIANVVMNRADHPRRWGNTIHSVILQPYQFSCFNPSDPNAEKILDRMWEDSDSGICMLLSSMAIEEELADVTQTYDDLPGATHYHNLSVSPSWASRIQFLRQIGNHKFYREI